MHFAKDEVEMRSWTGSWASRPWTTRPTDRSLRTHAATLRRATTCWPLEKS